MTTQEYIKELKKDFTDPELFSEASESLETALKSLEYSISCLKATDVYHSKYYSFGVLIDTLQSESQLLKDFQFNGMQSMLEFVKQEYMTEEEKERIAQDRLKDDEYDAAVDEAVQAQNAQSRK